MISKFEIFTSIITRLNREIKKIKTKEVEEYSLSGSHVTMMYFLNKYNGLTLKELTDFCLEDKAGVSRLVNILKNKGLLETQDDNKYKNKITLNEQGKKIASEIDKKINEFVDCASSGIGEKDRQVMYACLETICSNLQKFYN